MSSSEIITNIDNSIYHLHLKPGQLSTDIILVGDPEELIRLVSILTLLNL